MAVLSRDNAPVRVPARITLDWEPPIAGRKRTFTTWKDYMAIASQIVGRFHNQFRLGHFDYVHPARLQPGVPRRFRKPPRPTRS